MLRAPFRPLGVWLIMVGVAMALLETGCTTLHLVATCSCRNTTHGQVAMVPTAQDTETNKMVQMMRNPRPRVGDSMCMSSGYSAVDTDASSRQQSHGPVPVSAWIVGPLWSFDISRCVSCNSLALHTTQTTTKQPRPKGFCSA
jgi:hypothetical protein